MAVATVVIVLVVLFVGRSTLAARDRSHVHVLTDANALTCEGTRVERRAVTHSDAGEVEIPMVQIERDMRCDYTFSVSNDGGERVRLQRVRFPFLGPAGGVPVEAVTLEPHGIRPNQEETVDAFTSAPVDAIFDVDVDLEPHSDTTLTLHLVYRPDGCLPAGGETRLWDTPKLTLRSRGVTGERTAATEGFGFIGHPILNCDGP